MLRDTGARCRNSRFGSIALAVVMTIGWAGIPYHVTAAEKDVLTPSPVSIDMPAGSAGADALDATLERAGMNRADLGRVPRGWWMRYPRTTLHKLDHYDDLMREPTAMVPFTRTLAQAVKDFLGPEEMARPSRKQYESVGGHSLYRLVELAAVEPRFGGLRVASPRLTAEEASLQQAILEIYKSAGEPTRFTYAASRGELLTLPNLEAEISKRAAQLSPEVSRILGRLVLDVLSAHQWAALAFRDVPADLRIQIGRPVDIGVGMLQVIAGREYPQVSAFDDAAKKWDEGSLWYAALKCVEALDRARIALEALPRDKLRSTGFEWETPLGWIRISGPGVDSIDGTDALLLVDLGGDDEWRGPVAASSPTRLVGLALDLSGDDRYQGRNSAQGVGIAGVGVLLDAAGNDRYEADRYAQGVGQFGLGALIDLRGKDVYRAASAAQGSSPFCGIGLLADAAGNDEYQLLGDGQGFAGPGGVGLLADRTGNDTYRAEPDPDKSGRVGYLSNQISSSGAQGFAMGRFQGPASSNAWAGGLGALIDIDGDDRYLAGDWSQGTGYFLGTGLLYDGTGNDRYEGGYGFTQASAAHFGIGVLLDDGGDDQHRVLGHFGLAFAHDLSLSVFVATGGNDRYEILERGPGLGYSLNRGTSLFVELGGNDIYRAPAGTIPGFAAPHRRFLQSPDGTGVLTDPEDEVAHFLLIPAMAYVASVGLFLDVEGTDSYWEGLSNDSAWGDRRDSENWKARNVGIGMDVAAGSIDWRSLPVQQ